MISRKDLKSKSIRHQRRKSGLRRKIYGTAESPRLTVFRSSQNIYCQIIDDYSGLTLAAASTRGKDLSGSIDGAKGNCRAAEVVGKAIAEKAKAAGISKVQFDRNGYKFHGRVKALAEAAREAGLKF